jgi:hypothetical protein
MNRSRRRHVGLALVLLLLAVLVAALLAGAGLLPLPGRGG